MICKYIAIIPARSGSKRLPGKNVKSLGDKPLICHSLEAALEANEIDKVIFTSDSDDYIKIAKAYPEVVTNKRPKELATGECTNIEVIKYLLQELKNTRSIEAKNVVLLQPTSPFRTSHDIDESINIYKSSGQKTLASVTGPYKKRHPIFMRKTNDNDPLNCSSIEPLPINHEEEVYKYNASIYICSADYLRESNTIFSSPQAFYAMEEWKIDIDTAEDFDLANAILRHRHSQANW